MDKDSGCVVGMDLGDREARVCVLDADGEVVDEGTVRMRREALRHRFGGTAPMRVVLEAGTHSRWASQELEAAGHEVLVANPRRVRMIFGADDKSDKLDAERLARLGRSDPKLLYTIRHRSDEAQAALTVLRSRHALVKSRTGLINHVRGVVKAEGSRLPSSSAEAFPRLAESIPARLQPVLVPLLGVIERLSEQIAAYDREMERLCDEVYPETELLRQVHGVGPIVSLAFVATLEDHRRFRNSRAVGRYLGLVPRQDQSGAVDKQLRITKSGDRFLRMLLVQSANYILGPFGRDSDLRRWGLGLAGTGDKNRRRRAKVAVARKLSVVLHSLWKTGEEYEPLRNTRLRGELEELPA